VLAASVRFVRVFDDLEPLALVLDVLLWVVMVCDRDLPKPCVIMIMFYMQDILTWTDPQKPVLRPGWARTFGNSNFRPSAI
jgi:hypothetical protein